MCQSTWKSFRDALEKCQRSTEFDMQGRTLTVRYEFAGQEANGSQALGSQLYTASELMSSAGLCDMCGESPHDISDCQETKFLMFLGICNLDRDGHVVLRDGSALPRAEGKGGAAQVIRE